ncbi:hypothetical protein CYLTODRAFT_495178 [Cylindrobasidium torrendii FP15055 ss-10]|uniref:RING-type domain-containing protein n=1 Tax=Cylindrobasidium torrendii FP15055 ss-10 TaxID=1314674 RepID=A0A0D7AWD3_9AGAR|nr:hypothetical protein CYLTODRAFT_495178 [Cylindrobasidium torrendii FP15055 ss-10]
MESDSEYSTNDSYRSLVAQKRSLDEIVLTLDDLSDENGEQDLATDGRNKRVRVGGAETSSNAAGPSNRDVSPNGTNYQDTQSLSQNTLPLQDIHDSTPSDSRPFNVQIEDIFYHHDGTDSPTTVENMLALPNSPEGIHASAAPLPADAGLRNSIFSESYPATQTLRDADTQSTLEFRPSFADFNHEVPPLPRARPGTSDRADPSALFPTSLRASEHPNSSTRAVSLDIGTIPTRNLPVPHEHPPHVWRQMWPQAPRVRGPSVPQPIPPMDVPPLPHFPPANLDDYAPGAFRNALLFMRERAQRAQQEYEEYEEAEAMFERGYRVEQRLAQRARARQQLAAGLGSLAVGPDGIPQRTVPMVFPDELRFSVPRSSQQPAPADAVKDLKTMTRRKMLKMKEEEGGQEDGSQPREVDEESCPICLDEYTSDTLVTRLSCSHWLHKPCLDSWLERADTCPLCRNPVAPRQTQVFPSIGYPRLGRVLPDTPRTISDNIRARRTGNPSTSTSTEPDTSRRLHEPQMFTMGQDVAAPRRRADLHFPNRPRLQPRVSTPRTEQPTPTESLEDNSDPQQVEERMVQQAILASLADVRPVSQAGGSSTTAGPSQLRPSTSRAGVSSQGYAGRPPSRPQTRMNAFHSALDYPTEHGDSYRPPNEDRGASVSSRGPSDSWPAWTFAMDCLTRASDARLSSRAMGMPSQTSPQALQEQPTQRPAGMGMVSRRPRPRPPRNEDFPVVENDMQDLYVGGQEIGSGMNTTRRTSGEYMGDNRFPRLIDIYTLSINDLERMQQRAEQTVHRPERSTVRRPTQHPGQLGRLVEDDPTDSDLPVHLSLPQNRPLADIRRAGQSTDPQRQAGVPQPAPDAHQEYMEWFAEDENDDHWPE